MRRSMFTAAPLHPRCAKPTTPADFAPLAKLGGPWADHLEERVGRHAPPATLWAHRRNRNARIGRTAFMTRSGSAKEAVHAVLERSNQLHDPRYMGHQVAVPSRRKPPLGMVTDMLNNGQAIYEMGPTNATLEDLLLNEVGKSLGLPAGCGGVLCHGGTLGQLGGPLAAQRKVRPRPGPLAPRHRVRQTLGGARLRTSPLLRRPRDPHHGMGARRGGVGPNRRAPPNVTWTTWRAKSRSVHDGKQRCWLWSEAHAPRAPGRTTPSKALPNGPKLKTVWFHVDGAHGAPAGFSDTHRHLVKGMSNWPTAWSWIFTKCGIPPSHRRPLPRRQAESFLPFVPACGIPLGDAKDKIGGTQANAPLNAPSAC